MTSKHHVDANPPATERSSDAGVEGGHHVRPNPTSTSHSGGDGMKGKAAAEANAAETNPSSTSHGGGDGAQGGARREASSLHDKANDKEGKAAEHLQKLHDAGLAHGKKHGT